MADDKIGSDRNASGPPDEVKAVDEDEVEFNSGLPPVEKEKSDKWPGVVYVYRIGPPSPYPGYIVKFRDTLELYESIGNLLGGGRFRIITKWRGRGSRSRRISLEGDPIYTEAELAAEQEIQVYLNSLEPRDPISAYRIRLLLDRSLDAKRSLLWRLGFPLRRERVRPDATGFSFPFLDHDLNPRAAPPHAKRPEAKSGGVK